MEVTILAFGIAKDMVKGEFITIELPEQSTVADVKALLETRFPELAKLTSYMVAVNNEYASLHKTLKPGDEIAIIPPVSGG